MGRAALGSAAKTEVAAGRITKTEKDLLVRKYGSLANFVRAKVNEELEKELAT